MKEDGHAPARLSTCRGEHIFTMLPWWFISGGGIVDSRFIFVVVVVLYSSKFYLDTLYPLFVALVTESSYLSVN
jgi:hypothetical protein